MLNNYFLFIFLLTNTLFYSQKTKQLDVLDYYKENKDITKFKATMFLIDNLPIHKSVNYKWVDSLENIVPFSELNYSDIDEALNAFKSLKDSVKIHPQTYTIYDKEILTDTFLIKNIDMAFESWRNNPWSRSYGFKTFCEYILPYRSLTEPLEDWRKEYQFLTMNSITRDNNKLSDPVSVASEIILGLKDYRFQSSRPDPIPVLSPKQLLFRRAGSCSDLANLALLACRSVGLAATFDFTPHYAASSNRHFWNTIIDNTGKHIPFNGNSYGNRAGLPYRYDPAIEKRMAKVYRRTFSIQKNSLAFILELSEIPEGFLKHKNIIDVTHEYMNTVNLDFDNIWHEETTIAYLNVFNNLRWRAVDWSKKQKMSFKFKNLGKNIVYLPSIYKNKRRRFAPYPILIDDVGISKILKPDYQHVFDLTFYKNNSTPNPYLYESNSLNIEQGKRYSLFVWDRYWKKIDTNTAKGFSVFFKNIPQNGLFLIRSKHTNKRERIFTINTKGKKITWY